MRSYRIYSFEGVSRVIAADSIKAENDAKAIVIAKEVAAGSSYEVWQEHRLVTRCAPTTSA
jgi:hypothetical protein